MKGQIMAVMSAVAAVFQSGEAPVQIKFLIEGEEEIGSPHLAEFLAKHKELLKAHMCLNPDTGMLGAGMPTITYGLRGLAYFELRLRGPARDLHSGAFGGVIHNPAQVLCELVAGMHDDRGRVVLPDFYDSVRPLDAEERAEMARLPMDEGFYSRNAGVSELWGEEGFSPVERIGARPTLEVNGVLSGFTGPGTKTVLPAAAMAKLSMRLVPDQRPDEVEAQLRAYLGDRVPPTIRWELERLAGSPPSLSDRASPGVTALSKAMETVWGTPPLFRREGGSVPVTAYLQQLLGMESLLTGFALPDDNAHSPNERLHLPTWERGCEAIVHFLYNLSGNPLRDQQESMRR
jgi:acetylornithine deacetylase/succinyl-diaminopimelate desuccinylase-like protein